MAVLSTQARSEHPSVPANESNSAAMWGPTSPQQPRKRGCHMIAGARPT